MKHNILMTGAGAPGAAGIIKCLQEGKSFLNLFVADSNNNAYGKYLNSNFFQLPNAFNEKYIDILIENCKTNKIETILPLTTNELFVLSQHKDYLKSKNINVIVSSNKSILLSNNKGTLYNILKENKLTTPEYFIANSIDELKIAIINLENLNNVVCIKPTVSNGSRGFRIVSESIDEYDILFNQKPNNTFITKNKLFEILNSSDEFKELLVSEYLPGEEYSVDCLANNGEAKIILPRIRKKMQLGISIEGEFIENKILIDKSKTIIKLLNLHGNIGIQFKKSKHNIFEILEINPRVQGTIVTCLGAGVNLPLLSIKQELNIPIDFKKININWGTKFSRFWNEVYYF